jgi:CheY-like chemotaxis protein
VAKILVADDNSNIQKMVGLALKDQGIDVVAVGNGEAAVRKISDIHPDLVLADVFMPVRNGYEVCQYVKQDSALAHIPVILLVGAFDPLDEQEAQRVGADGVLKKPFVPPDPLIAMVKAALTRAGVSYSLEKKAASSEKTIASEKAGKNVERKPVEFVAPKPEPVPEPVVMSAPVLPPESIAMEDMDGLVEEVALAPAPVKMEGGAPLAFGNLMESGGTAEEDPGFSPQVHPELAVERDWRAEEDEDVPEEEEEEKPKASWRRDADLDEAPAGVSETVRDWQDTAFNEPAARKSARESLGAAEPVPAMTEAAATTENTATISEGAVAAVTTIHPGAEKAAPAFSADAWANAISAGESEGIDSNEAGQASAKNGSHGLTEEKAPSAAALAVEHDAVATAIDRFAGSQDAQGESEKSPMASGMWESQAMKSSLLSATWDTPVAATGASAVVISETAEVAETAAAFVESVPSVTEHAATGQVGEIATAEKVETGGEVDAPGGEHIAAVEPEETPKEYATTAGGSTGDARAGNFEASAEADAALSAYAAESTGEVSGSEAATEEIRHAVVEEVAAPRAEERYGHEGSVQAAEASAGEPAAEIAHVEAVVDDGACESAAAIEPAAVATVERAPDDAATGNAEGAAASSANEDVVARVLASLSPEVMQAVTRELLKPVVEAMVREELNKRK